MRIVLVGMVLLACSSALAQNREAAREAFKSGSQHYKLGEYKEALDDFKLAFRSYEDPSFLYNIAQCERQLGQREEAVREYRMYLAESADAPNRDEVHALIARLEHEIADARAASKATAANAPATAANAPATSATSTTTAAHANAVLTATAPPRRATPAYKKWWVWTVVGVVAAGGAAGLAVGLTRGGPAPTASTTLGTAHPYN